MWITLMNIYIYWKWFKREIWNIFRELKEILSEILDYSIIIKIVKIYHSHNWSILFNSFFSFFIIKSQYLDLLFIFWMIKDIFVRENYLLSFLFKKYFINVFILSYWNLIYMIFFIFILYLYCLNVLSIIV